MTLGQGNNTVNLGNGSDSVVAGNGNNTVTLGTGSDSVAVGNGGNTITVSGSPGSTDSISAGNGNNALNLGAGTYNMRARQRRGYDQLGQRHRLNITAGHGTDEFVFSTPAALLNLKFASNDELVFRNSGFDFGSFNGTGTATPQPIPGSLFSSRTDGTFATPTNRFAYDGSMGKLYYDAQGSTPGSTASLLADFSNKPHLTAANLFFTT